MALCTADEGHDVAADKDAVGLVHSVRVAAVTAALTQLHDEEESCRTLGVACGSRVQPMSACGCGLGQLQRQLQPLRLLLPVARELWGWGTAAGAAGCTAAARTAGSAAAGRRTGGSRGRRWPPAAVQGELHGDWG